ATARPGRRRSTCSPSGSRSTSTTRAGCSGRRSTTADPSEQGVGSRAVEYKLVVFVPPGSLEAVRDAIFAAGAGRIGGYERCSWYAAGTGTFLGGEGTNPAVGAAGSEQRIPELRLETVFPADRQDDVLAALRAAHPYEEPAFDV